MKLFNFIKTYVVILVITLFAGCDNMLQEHAYSQLDPETVLSDRQGIESVLISAYGNINFGDKALVNEWEGYPADLTFARGGGEERQARIMENWEWDSSTNISGGNSADSFINVYSRHYNVIRDTNIILDNIGEVQGISDDVANSLIAETKFLRAWAYYRLYKYLDRKSTRLNSSHVAISYAV